MRPIDSSSPRNANGAIIAPVLTPVTTSNCGRAISPVTLPHPLSTPAPNAPQSPPPEMISKSTVGCAHAVLRLARLEELADRPLRPAGRLATGGECGNRDNKYGFHLR